MAYFCPTDLNSFFVNSKSRSKVVSKFHAHIGNGYKASSCLCSLLTTRVLAPGTVLQLPFQVSLSNALASHFIKMLTSSHTSNM